MKQLLNAFLQEQTKENFLALRAAIRDSASYSPYSSDLRKIEVALFENDFDTAQALLKSSMPNLLLSPRAHLFAAILARRKGEEKTIEMETFFANACAKGILSTGDGSEHSPYLVLRVDDERDVLKFLERKLLKQSLVHQGNRRLDCVTLEDSGALYFDVTDAFVKLAATAS